MLLACTAAVPLLLFSGMTEASAQDTAPSASAVAPAEQEKPTYPDLESGDRARAAGEYGAAASFYRQYRAKAEQNGDAEARKDAYARELDALILANLADSAGKLLDEYRAAFPQTLDPKSVSLWQAEILLLQRRTDDADKLLQKLIPSLEKLDPGYYRALSCAAFVAELKGDHAAAAKNYGDIASNAGVKTSFGRRAAERQALSLAALGKYAEAYDILNALPVADNKRDVDALKLLSFYLTLLEKGSDAIAEDWSGIRALSGSRKDNLFFLAACRIGEEFSKRGDHVRAAEAFHLAYSFASIREDAFDATTRLIGAFQRLNDRKTAADLAVRMISLFKDAGLSADFKLQIASILFRADRPDDALDVCLSCISDAVPAAEHESVYRKVLDAMIAEKAFPSARKFVEAFDTVPAKKPARSMDRAEIAWREGKPAEAAKLYRAVGESSAEFRSKALLNAMRCSLEAGLFADLLDVAAQLRKTDADRLDPDVIYLSAIAQEKTGDTAAAAQSYLDYEKAAPKTAATQERRGSALYAAGRLLIRLGEPGKALACLRNLRQNYGTLSVAEPGRYWLIHALYASGDDVGAERESWRFIDDSPDSEYAGAALLRLAEHYRGTGSVQHAENTIDQILKQEKYPKIRARASYEKALIAYQRDDLSSALAALDSIDGTSTDAALQGDVHYLRGDIARDLNDFSKARAEYEAAAKAVPGSLLEQAALGSAADCIYALATGSAAESKPKETAPAGPQTQAKPATAQPAGTNKPAPSEPSSEAPGVAFPSAAACRLAFDAYQELLKLDGLRLEYRAMAIYKSGQSLWKAGDEKEAINHFIQMIYLVPPRDAAARPVEAFWVFRAVDALESLAHKDPSVSNVEAAVSALVWLGQTGTSDPALIRQRVRALRKKQYQPPLPAASNTTTSPESSQT